MGAYESKPDILGTPETPHYAKYSDLFSLDEDPRSPSGISRTPIIVQNPVVDPRSPSNYVERTPVFSIPEPVSPYVRYKMENPGYQDSPLTSTIEFIGNNKQDHGIAEDIRQMKIGENNTEESNNEEFLESEEISSNSSSILQENVSDKTSLINKKNSQRNTYRRSNKQKHSMLKQALFKPLMDENLSANNKESSKCQKGNTRIERAPLQKKELCFENENVLKSGEKLSTHQGNFKSSDNMAVKKRLPLEESVDKENLHFA